MSGFKNPITIIEAIRNIQRNDFLLPAFQREFTWNCQQVERLFDSLMEGYPVGSLLLWRVRGEARSKYRFYRILENFRERHLTHNAPFDTKLKESFFAILDGQQRLTSLYIGLCGSFAYHRHYARYDDTEWNFPTRHLYLNLSRISDDDSEQKYGFCFIDKAVTTDTLYTDDKGDKWYRVGEVLTFTEDYDVHDFADEHQLTREERKLLSRLHTMVTKDEVINYYEEDTDSPDKAVTIFVRINSGGTRLSFADILMSITVAAWQKDAREEILHLVDQVNAMGFWISHEYVLKAFLFLEHSDVRFRIRSFDNGFIELIESRWEGIRDSVLETFRLVRSFGLNNSTLTSYYATLPILYRIYLCRQQRGFATSTAYLFERADIHKWLLKTLLMRSFTFGLDTKLQAARRALRECDVFNSAGIDKAIGQSSSVTDDFVEELLSTQYEDRRAFILLSFLYPHLDYSGTDYHIDHIHSVAECERHGIEKMAYNSLPNLQMLNATENKSKNDTPLRDWIDKQNNRTAFLNLHLLPDTDFSIERFEDFIRQRREMLRQQLKAMLT